jgi:DNA polymerase-3 subunit delta'
MAKRVSKSAAEDLIAAATGAGDEPVAPVHGITTLDQIIGQAGAKRTLERAMQSGRVHHAWIFHGPAGVGKKTAAVAFAAAMLDPSTSADLGGNLVPEQDSAVQRLVRSGTHPDLHIITKELAAMSREDTVRKGKQFGIAKEVVEEFLTEPAGKSRMMPGESRAGKVFIVDEAELLSPISQNTLLKTLEEPPAGTVIVLVTSAEERLLPTIRSRCQRVSFSPLEEGEMNKWLSRRGV